MSRIAFVNGRYVAHALARVHIEDRGYQFSDGVYEVCEVRDACLIDAPRHLARLERSLCELKMTMPCSAMALALVLFEIVRRNRLRNGMVYLQMTRGTARRDHAFPAESHSALVVTARPLDPIALDARAAAGAAAITKPDLRWKRVDIKTIGLLANVMARQEAREAGAFETWFVDDDGYVTEGAATNAWIVDRNGMILTRPVDGSILAGVTRATLLDAIAGEGLRVEERKFSRDEALGAREAFCSGATMRVMPIIRMDGSPIGDGGPGAVSMRLRSVFDRYAHRSASPKQAAGMQ